MDSQVICITYCHSISYHEISVYLSFYVTLCFSLIGKEKQYVLTLLKISMNDAKPLNYVNIERLFQRLGYISFASGGSLILFVFKADAV